MKKDKTKIFLCHASEDKKKVLDVYKRLKQEGFKPWLDKEDLLPGQYWDIEIPKAIKASDFILIFFSKISVFKRGYVQKEFKLALNVLEEIPDGQFFVIPVRVDECNVPERFQRLQYCDLFESSGIEQIVKAILTESTKQTHIERFDTFRTSPQINLSEKDVKAMLNQYSFFCKEYDWNKSFSNPQGNGITHDFTLQENGQVVYDGATELMWQQSGSEKNMTYSEAEWYIRDLNNKQFAGYNDWCLPILEEAMSLMEHLKKHSDLLYIDPIYDSKQIWIWTADKHSAGMAWSVDFIYGSCGYGYVVDIYSKCVRAVRHR